MAEVNWALGQMPNPGQAFMDAYRQGSQNAAQNKARAAAAALVRDPNNTAALEALASVDPQAAMTFQERQRQQAMQGLEQHREKILMGARIVRQVQPKDQAGWEQVLSLAGQMGIDLADVPRQFDPQYVQGLTQVADALAPQKEAQDPGIIREFDIATQRGLVPPGTTYQQYVQMRNPSMVAPVTLPYNATVVGGGESMPTVSTPDEAMKLPPGTQFRMPDGRIGTVPGGAGGNASGGFRDPLAPLDN